MDTSRIILFCLIVGSVSFTDATTFVLERPRIQCQDSWACPLDIVRNAECNMKDEDDWTCDVRRSFNTYSFDSTSESMFDVTHVNLTCHGHGNCTLTHSLFVKSFDGLVVVVLYHVAPYIVLAIFLLFVLAYVADFCRRRPP